MYLLRLTILIQQKAEPPRCLALRARVGRLSSLVVFTTTLHLHCVSYAIALNYRVTFRFKSSKRSNNGTDVASGQIPEILYRIPEIEKETGVPIQLLDKTFSSTVSPV